MTRRKKSKAGRPSLGAAARNRLVTIKLSEAEYQAIAAAVAKENLECTADGGDGTTATISSWMRDHALDPLGMATFRSDDA